MPPNIYTDSKLDSDRNEIRLMELAPGYPDDDLSASLSPASLDNALSYEALSYVWGDTTMLRSINLCSSSLSITKNLEAALRQVRLPSHTRKLWVDAICINQNNPMERQIQVQLMRRIYTQSARVLVWLGEEEEGDKEAIDFLKSLSGTTHTSTRGFLDRLRFLVSSSSRTHAFTRNCLDPPRAIYRRGDCETPMRELKSLVDRPWWSRAWTLQEIVCGKECQLYCGRLVISWHQMLQAYDQLRMNRFTSIPTTLCSLCSSGLNAYTQRIGDILAHRRGIETGTLGDLLECVVRHRSRSATDPRDKVYAFLGISADFQADLIVPNYTETVEYVYIDFAFQTLKMDGPRVLLHTADYVQSRYQLPSWVPDWTSPKLTSLGDIVAVTRQLRYKLFNACGNKQASVIFYRDISPGVLAFEGVLVDSVLRVGELHPWGNWRPVYSVFKQWQDLAQFESSPDRPYTTSIGTFKEAFWRTILCDTVIMGQMRGSQYSRAAPEHEEYFWRAWHIGSKSEAEISSSSLGIINVNGGPVWESPSVYQILGSIPVGVLGRRFFVTKMGFIGIGPSKVQEGDEVWVVARCKVPLIVRKSETEVVRFTTKDKVMPLYTLVGDSYVHGVMNGEKTNCWDQDKSLLMLQ